jgi:DNA-binding PadR family transcriptional regulator
MESLPVTEPVLLILLSLAEQPRHGYAILHDVQEMSEGRVTLSTGTLYGALRRLLDGGWIERFDDDDNSRGRQAYRLTPEAAAICSRKCRLNSSPESPFRVARKET